MPVFSSADPPFIGDHVVMDLLNTVALAGDEAVDFWQNDADVLRWLRRFDMIAADAAPELRQGRLLETARRLREMARTLVRERKQRRRLDLAPLNAFLALGRSYSQLTQSRSGEIELTRRYDGRTPEQWLTPLAEAVAGFLASANFEWVRPCEGERCILWFYDRTKSHRRRWCSMGVCGNRHKVAAFRSRQR